MSNLAKCRGKWPILAFDEDSDSVGLEAWIAQIYISDAAATVRFAEELHTLVGLGCGEIGPLLAVVAAHELFMGLRR